MLAVHQKEKGSKVEKNKAEEMTRLWSFDIWHESLYEDATNNDATNAADLQ